MGDETLKRCRTCSVEKTEDQFYKSARYGGLYRECKPCRRLYEQTWKANNPDKVKAHNKRENAYKKQWYAGNKERIRVLRRCYKYALTEDEYLKILDGQGRKCAICKQCLDESNLSRTPHIDHDHSCCPSEKACSKCVRGILCGECNRMLGCAKDQKEVLQAGIEYLQIYTKGENEQRANSSQ